MPKALIVGAVALVGALLTMRVYKRWKSRTERVPEFDVPDPIWSSTETPALELCIGTSNDCIGLGQNAVQFLDLHRTKSFELFGCDSNGTCTRDTGVTATINDVKYTASQTNYTGATPTKIKLEGEKPMIRLWTEQGHRGRYTVLQGDREHVISNAMYDTYRNCPDGYRCKAHKYYYGQDVPDDPCPPDGQDSKGHRCVQDAGSWQKSKALSFTMVPDAAT
jgi:hypothetical protein